MTRDDIAYLAWKNNTVEEEIEPVYRGYQYGDTSNKMHGAFKNSIDQKQEGTYTLAYLYQEPLSRYYQNEHVLKQFYGQSIT